MSIMTMAVLLLNGVSAFITIGKFGVEVYRWVSEGHDHSHHDQGGAE